MSETVLYTREDQVAIVTLNRPEKMNALNKEMNQQLFNVISEIKANAAIRVVVLCGAGEAFMSGTDLDEMNNDFDTIAYETLEIIRQFHETLLTLREMNKIVISSVHGLVAATGLSLMLATDLVIASQETRFCVGFNSIATTPAGGLTYHLPRLIGMKKAMQLILMSEVFNAETALQLGLINWVVPRDKLKLKTQEVIDYLIHGPTLALAYTKRLLISAWQNKITTQLGLEAEAFTKSVNSRDFKTAVKAFVNKRPPEFEGR